MSEEEAKEPVEEEGGSEVSGVTCEWCGEVFKSDKALDSHVGKRHPKELLSKKGLPTITKMSEEDTRAMIAQEGRDGLNKLKRDRLAEVLSSHPKVASRARVYILRKWETNERMRDDWREMFAILRSAGIPDDVAYDIINDVWSLEEKYGNILQLKGQRVFTIPPKSVDQFMVSTSQPYQQSASYYPPPTFGQFYQSPQPTVYPSQATPTQPVYGATQPPIYGGGLPFGYTQQDLIDRMSRMFDDKFKPVSERIQQVEQRIERFESKGEEEVVEVETMIPLKDPQTGDVIVGNDGKPVTYPRKMRGPMSLFMASGFLVEKTPSLTKEDVRSIVREEQPKQPQGPTEREKILEDKVRELTNAFKEQAAKIDSYREELTKKERESEKKELMSKIEALEERHKATLDELKATREEITRVRSERRIEGYQSDETRFLGQALSGATDVARDVLKDKRLLEAVRLVMAPPAPQKELPPGAGRTLATELPAEYVEEK
jgi:uncharacterized C2H2 Zn-finger protein